jgi:hypothetical protein
MKILSIDVGMKNLAYCLFEFNADQTSNAKDPESMMQLVNIMAWDTVNLCDAPASTDVVSPTTCTNPGCKFAAKFMHASCSSSDNNENNALDAPPAFYCTRHANASGYKMPLLVSSKSLKKMTLEELKTFSDEHLSGSIPEKCAKSKMKLLQHLEVAIAAEYLVAVTAKARVVSAASIDLITIGRNMHRRFDALPHLSGAGIDVVIIENQLSTLATRMKTLQGMITQYFIMRGVPDIRFISAINKLKLFAKEGEEEGGYADRKKRSIEITRGLITPTPVWSMKFEKHKKKDDLADCFLQGMWWLCKRG